MGAAVVCRRSRDSVTREGVLWFPHPPPGCMLGLAQGESRGEPSRLPKRHGLLLSPEPGIAA